jgi:hypothetical protein
MIPKLNVTASVAKSTLSGLIEPGLIMGKVITNTLNLFAVFAKPLRSLREIIICEA